MNKKIFGQILLVILALGIFLAPMSVFATEEKKNMAEQCANFEFPEENQKMEVGDVENLSDVEKGRLEQYLNTFYNSFGCPVDNISLIQYKAPTDTDSGKAEVHVVFKDNSFHKWTASDIMKKQAAEAGTNTSLNFEDDKKPKETSCEEGNRAELDVLLARAKAFVADANNDAEKVKEVQSLLDETNTLLQKDCVTQAELDAASLKFKTIFDSPTESPLTADHTEIVYMGFLMVSLLCLGSLAFVAKKNFSSQAK